jgi:membrane associated rhomboid family serine protease
MHYDTRLPVMTVALLLILVAVFGLELTYAVEPTNHYFPTRPTLIALGAFDRTLIVRQHEWWRLLSGALLQTGPIQLVLNGAGLLFAGLTLDRLIGPGWVWADYMLSALGGAALAAALGGPDLVAAGAGPAVLGVLATSFVCSFHEPPGRMRRQAQEGMLRGLLAVLIAAAIEAIGIGPGAGDFNPFGFLGGALAGAATGLVILALWPEAEFVPNLDELAKVISAAGLCVFALAGLGTMRHYEGYAAFITMIPPGEVPKTEDDARQNSLALVQHYPRDPRAHLFYARTLLDQQDFKAAETELRTGLNEQDILHRQFKPDMERQMRTMLAVALNQGGDAAGAKEQARIVCTALPANAAPVELTRAHLCE